MIIDDSTVAAYLEGHPAGDYSDCWIYFAAIPGQKLFAAPDPARADEVRACHIKARETCRDFCFKNDALVLGIFGDIANRLSKANIVLTVGFPYPYDAFILQRGGVGYATIDLVQFADYVKNGRDMDDLMRNFLSHELIHILINEDYPIEELEYIEYLSFIAFHEGFAHLLSYREDIASYSPGDEYRKRFKKARDKLLEALSEEDPDRRAVFQRDANAGEYWDKFASIASMLYLMRHVSELPRIYRDGWRGYADRIAAYEWE